MPTQSEIAIASQLAAEVAAMPADLKAKSTDALLADAEVPAPVQITVENAATQTIASNPNP